MTRLVAVTGATGFLGQHVVRAFASRGWRVRILARRDPVSLFWSGICPEVVPGGLFDAAALERLCDGADVVVHAAGLTGGRAKALHHVNVEGARVIAAAAVRTDARLLHISSLAAREPQLSSYAASKHQGETLVGEIMGERATIVRPPAIYGPGDPETLRLFAAAAVSPVLPVLDPGARTALVHVEDAARQIEFLAACSKFGPFTLCDARREGYGWSEIMRTAAAASGRNPRLAHIPSALLYVPVAIAALDIRPGKRNSVLSFGKVRELSHSDWGVSVEECALDTPTPQFDLSSGFRQTVAWYRTHGWL